ncbi:hypothetical protein K501DRAFT_189259 [Backusella circina FSU 941]|nr:hypothetical protein K501DRAFT_189259 [Backusella circina FSU 941]
MFLKKGSGVSGLTTAICLLREGHKNIRVIGQYIPGDLHTDYTSPWAGAAIVATGQPDNYRQQDIDCISAKEFARICEQAPESGVMFCPGVQYDFEKPKLDTDVYWARRVYSKVEPIPENELPKGAYYGYKFDSCKCIYIYTANVTTYLHWLVKELHRLGGQLERCNNISSLQELIEVYKDCDVLINCTGKGAAHLEDVKDKNVHPIRGQTVLLRAPHIKIQYHSDAENDWTYIIPRSDGNVICGGTVEIENTNPKPQDEQTKDILERAAQLCPEIKECEIVAVNVGFRPGRNGGIRIEKEIRHRSNGQKVTVCHNYGHKSHGYASSWGSSQKVIDLLKNEKLSKL